MPPKKELKKINGHKHSSVDDLLRPISARQKRANYEAIRLRELDRRWGLISKVRNRLKIKKGDLIEFIPSFGEYVPERVAIPCRFVMFTDTELIAMPVRSSKEEIRWPLMLIHDVKQHKSSS